MSKAAVESRGGPYNMSYRWRPLLRAASSLSWRWLCARDTPRWSSAPKPISVLLRVACYSLPKHSATSMDLRDYQEDAVNGIRNGLRQVDRVFLSLPTGGGKTVIFCHIAQGAIEKGNKVLILVHRRELIVQTSAALDLLGVSHGIIAAIFKGNNEPVELHLCKHLYEGCIKSISSCLDNH